MESGIEGSNLFHIFLAGVKLDQVHDFSDAFNSSGVARLAAQYAATPSISLRMT